METVNDEVKPHKCSHCEEDFVMNYKFKKLTTLLAKSVMTIHERKLKISGNFGIKT